MTMLRHPVDRIISEYSSMHRWKRMVYLNGLDELGNIDEYDNVEEFKKDLAIFNECEDSVKIQYLPDTIDEWSKKSQSQNVQLKWMMGKSYTSSYVPTEDDYYDVIDMMERLNFKVGIAELFVDSINYWNKSYNLNLIPKKKHNYITPGEFNYNVEVTEDVRDLILQNNILDYRLYKYFYNNLVYR